jgi:hypothetical protein
MLHKTGSFGEQVYKRVINNYKDLLELFFVKYMIGAKK